MRPSRDSVLMQVAEAMSSRSTCSRGAVGVVIARDGRVLSTGYNGAPAGMPHCDHSCNCPAQDDMRGHLDFCRSLQPCEISVHGECNAIAYAARYGVSVESATLLTTLSPCLYCGQLILNAGITRVVWVKEHRDRRGLDLLEQSDRVEVVRFGIGVAI